MENENNKEFFSYTSPELQQKNALKVLGIEAIVILIIVILIFVALNYFNIVKFSDIVKNFIPNSNQNSSSSSATQKNQAKISNAPDRNANPTIEAVSDIPGYSLTLENQDKLMQLLNSLNIFNKNYSPRYGLEGNTLGSPLKMVIIHLVDKDQVTNSFEDVSKNTYTSSLTKATPGTFDTMIYISKEALDGKIQNNPPGSIAALTFFYGMYRISKNPQDPQTSSKTSADFFNLAKTNPLMKNEYFIIQKK